MVASNQYRLQPGSRIRANSARAANGPGTKTPRGRAVVISGLHRGVRSRPRC